jgi:hypothetical protein
MRRWYSSCPRSPCVCFTPFARLPWRHLVFPSCLSLLVYAIPLVPSSLCTFRYFIFPPLSPFSPFICGFPDPLSRQRSTALTVFFLSCDGLYHGPPSYNLITFFFALSICYNSEHRSCSSPHSAFVEPPCNVYSSFPLFSMSYYRPRRNRQR